MARPKDYVSRSDRRSAQVFVIACEGEKNEAAYFTHLTQGVRRVRVVPLATGKNGKSSPLHLIERMNQAIGKFPDAQAWLVLDVDHHFQANHQRSTQRALNEARRRGYTIAVSNPCVELWFLLHLENVDCECDESFCTMRLKQLLPSYSHSNYNPELLRPGISDAIERARTLDSERDQQSPSNPGSRIYVLMDALRSAITDNGALSPF